MSDKIDNNDEFFFQRLKVYKDSKALVKEVYTLMKKFPSEERFALCDQLRRAIISVPSNIAEGMSRSSNKEKVHFLDISYGSLMEAFCQLDAAVDLGYITEKELVSVRSLFCSITKQLKALQTSIAKK